MPDRRLSVALRQDGPVPLDVAFSCGAGDVTAIFGPSGAGKTTILRSIAGLHCPREASVRSGDRTWTDTASGIVVPPHQRSVGLVFQEYALFPHLTALGNVTTALGHRPRRERRARAEALLALVHLSEHASRRPHELSGGERQRVAVARALARDPSVLLLDEPFAAVDRAIRRRLQDEIEEVRRSLDAPVVLVTHDFDDVLRLATHVLLLERGRQIAAGPIAALTGRPDLSWLRQAVGLGSVFDAVVSRGGTGDRLAELSFDGGGLVASAPGAVPGRTVRVRIPAREVILASRVPEGLSLHNVLSGRVTAVHPDAAFEHVIVQVAVGNTPILAEVTRDAVARLGITEGVGIHALVKSVSIDVQAAAGAAGAPSMPGPPGP